MKLFEIMNENKSSKSKDDNDVTLTLYNEEDPIDPLLAELCSQLLGLENSVQIRMVLKSYLEDLLPEMEWGGTAV